MLVVAYDPEYFCMAQIHVTSHASGPVLEIFSFLLIRYYTLKSISNEVGHLVSELISELLNPTSY